MGWNGKNDAIAMIFLLCGGFALIFMLVAIVAPIIFNIKDGGLDGIVKIIVLLGLSCLAIYILRCIYKKNKKQKNM